MSLFERREEIMEILCHRRSETITNLALEFGVSTKTIRNDIDAISRYIPVYTRPGKYGGVFIMQGYKRYSKFLTAEQKKALEDIIKGLPADIDVLQGILYEFDKSPKKS